MKPEAPANLKFIVDGAEEQARIDAEAVRGGAGVLRAEVRALREASAANRWWAKQECNYADHLELIYAREMRKSARLIRESFKFRRDRSAAYCHRSAQAIENARAHVAVSLALIARARKQLNLPPHPQTQGRTPSAGAVAGFLAVSE